MSALASHCALTWTKFEVMVPKYFHLILSLLARRFHLSLVSRSTLGWMNQICSYWSSSSSKNKIFIWEKYRVCHPKFTYSVFSMWILDTIFCRTNCTDYWSTIKKKASCTKILLAIDCQSGYIFLWIRIWLIGFAANQIGVSCEWLVLQSIRLGFHVNDWFCSKSDWGFICEWLVLQSIRLGFHVND